MYAYLPCIAQAKIFGLTNKQSIILTMIYAINYIPPISIKGPPTFLEILNTNGYQSWCFKLVLSSILLFL